MIAEGLQKIVDLVKQAQQHPIQQLKGDKPGRFYRQLDDGTPEFFEVEPGDRCVHGVTLPELVRNAGSPYSSKDTGDGIITYGPRYAMLAFDHLDGRSTMMWKADYSREYQVFFDWYNAGQDGILLSVDEAVQLFDTFLRPCMPSVDWLTQISLLKVQSEEAAEASRTAISSMAGGLVKSEVTSPMPDGEVEFKVRIINDTSFPRIPLKCYVRADMVSRRWMFMPIDDSWHAMHERQHEEVCARLEGAREYVGDIIRGTIDWKTHQG